MYLQHTEYIQDQVEENIKNSNKSLRKTTNLPIGKKKIYQQYKQKKTVYNHTHKLQQEI